MKARELALPYDTVRADAPARDAAVLLSREHCHVLLVEDDEGRVIGPLHDLDMLAALLPPYLEQDPALARVLGDGATAELWARLDGRRVADLLRTHDRDVPTVEAGVGVLAVAAEMLHRRTALVVVTDHGRLLGGITSSEVLTALLR